VLAQQIVAEAACRTIPEDELLTLVRGAYPYRALTKERFEQLLQMLNDGVQRRAKDAGARIHRDVVNHTVRGRRGARLAALTSGGAIPDTAQYAVVAEPEGIKRQIEILNSNLEQHRQEMRTETAALSDKVAREEVGRLERKNHAIGEAVAAGAAAVVMLATGFPLFLVAAAALPGAWAYYRNKVATEQEVTMGEIEYAVRMAVSEWVNDYVRSVVTDFQGKLLRENLSVAQLASDGYGRQREDFPGTEADLTELLGTVRRHLLSMSALTSGSRLLSTDA